MLPHPALSADHQALPEERARVAFLLRLGVALHRYGAPAHRLEGALTQVAARLGLVGRFFSTPTAIFASFGAQESLRTGLVRVEPGEMDLGRLVELDALSEEIVRGERTLGEASQRLEDLLTTPSRYGPLTTVLCHAFAATAGARLFGGGLKEAGVAALIGLAVGLVGAFSRKSAGGVRVVEPLAAFLAAFIASSASRLFGPLSVEVSTVAGLIVLLPGLALTIALTEIATRNLISGTARLTAAALVFLQLAFGVALGGKLAALVFTQPILAGTNPQPPAWTAYAALILGTISLVVLFRARWRDTGWVLLAALIAFGGARAGSSLLGPELGAFTGAFLLAVTSNLVGRVFQRPAVATIVPGLMLLVPGSIGFRSLESLLQQDVLAGVGTAFSMVLVGVAIVAGLLVANVVVAPRKVL